MKKFFKLSAEKMRAICGIAESRIFPVVAIENNTVGGKGFDAFVSLDSGDGWFKGAYVGKLEMFAARGEFVTEADYLAQCAVEAEEVETIVAQPVADEWTPEEDADAWKARDAEMIAVAQARGVSLSLVKRIAPQPVRSMFKFTVLAIKDASKGYPDFRKTVNAMTNADAVAIVKAKFPELRAVEAVYRGVSLDKPDAPECVARLANVTQESNADVMARAVAFVRDIRLTREYLAAHDDTGPEWEFFGYATRDGATWSVWRYADGPRFVYQATESENAPTGDGGYYELVGVLKLRQLTMCAAFPGSLVACEMKRALDAEQARADAARNLARGN